MKSNKPYQNTFTNRVAQFIKDQETAKPVPADKVATPAFNPPHTDNPYLRARHEVLKKYTPEHRAEIAMYERTGKINNRFYEEFCHEVAVLGDQYMPI